MKPDLMEMAQELYARTVRIAVDDYHWHQRAELTRKQVCELMIEFRKLVPRGKDEHED